MHNRAGAGWLGVGVRYHRYYGSVCSKPSRRKESVYASTTKGGERPHSSYSSGLTNVFDLPYIFTQEGRCMVYR